MLILQVQPLLDAERQKNLKECISIEAGTTVVLAPRLNASAISAPDPDSRFDMERAYLLSSVELEQRLFSELIRPLVDRFLAGFNATVR